MLVVVVVVVLSVYSLFDVLATDRARIRLLPKPVWAVVVLVPVLGPLAWLLAGRSRPTPMVPPRPRAVGPDDDPDFLWNLERRKRRRPDEDPPDPPAT